MVRSPSFTGLRGLFERERRDHLHGLSVANFSEVFLALAVGDDTQPVLTRSLGATLLVMLVEMDPDLVGTHGGILLPNNVLNGRVGHRSYVHVNVQVASAIALFVVEINPFSFSNSVKFKPILVLSINKTCTQTSPSCRESYRELLYRESLLLIGLLRPIDY